MDAIKAREIVESSKISGVDNLVARINTAIYDRASKGWKQAEVTNIVQEYSVPVINEAYIRLRTNGFNVNVIFHTVTW